MIGDVVNTAARVEEATRQTGDVILITDGDALRCCARTTAGWCSGRRSR